MALTDTLVVRIAEAAAVASLLALNVAHTLWRWWTLAE